MGPESVLKYAAVRLRPPGPSRANQRRRRPWPRLIFMSWGPGPLPPRPFWRAAGAGRADWSRPALTAVPRPLVGGVGPGGGVDPLPRARLTACGGEQRERGFQVPARLVAIPELSLNLAVGVLLWGPTDVAVPRASLLSQTP